MHQNKTTICSGGRDRNQTYLERICNPPHNRSVTRPKFDKYIMTLHECMQAVESLLKSTGKTFTTSHAKMLYERGYLTGFIARQMLTNPLLRRDITERLERLKRKK